MAFRSSGWEQVSCRVSRRGGYRSAWVRVHGRVPDGKVLHHLCFNHRCAEVRHLVAVTLEEHGQIHYWAQVGKWSGVMHSHRR
jgi:hypothetical protein